ncbi:MAG: hypothetical protein RLN69_08315 [Woeseiaceae bacterium]
MRMRLALIAMPCVLLSMFLQGCGGAGDTPEDELRLWVANAQAAVEEEDRATLMGMLAENYADARGNDRSAIDQVFRFYFLRQDSVVLVSNIEEITISGETAAIVRLTAAMAGANDAALGFSADAYRFELELENHGNEWLLVAARWRELGEKIR